MRKWLRYILPLVVVIIVGGIAALIYLFNPSQGCACMADPSLHLDQKEAEYVIAAEIPVEATQVIFTSYRVDYLEEANDYTNTEVYVSFALPPETTTEFLKTLPNLAPMQPNHTPFKGRLTYITNFGEINGTPEIFEGSTYDFPLCYRAVMVDKSNAELYHVYIYARCEGL